MKKHNTTRWRGKFSSNVENAIAIDATLCKSQVKMKQFFLPKQNKGKRIFFSSNMYSVIIIFLPLSSSSLSLSFSARFQSIETVYTTKELHRWSRKSLLRHACVNCILIYSTFFIGNHQLSCIQLCTPECVCPSRLRCPYVHRIGFIEYYGLEYGVVSKCVFIDMICLSYGSNQYMHSQAIGMMAQAITIRATYSLVYVRH